VVAGDTQGLREIVRPGENGELAEPGNAQALADAVARTIADWSITRTRAEAARMEAEERYSPATYRRSIVAELQPSVK
jgi:glycosyltransferase involved in cell wall biosynthesis